MLTITLSADDIDTLSAAIDDYLENLIENADENTTDEELEDIIKNVHAVIALANRLTPDRVDPDLYV